MKYSCSQESSLFIGFLVEKKKSYLKGYLAAIKTEVKKNHYLTTPGIKSFQKQTAGNNYPVCMTDPLIVRLRAAEIRFV